mgnify:CR=1 FL=1
MILFEYSNYRQFLPQGNTVKVTVQPQRLIDTAPGGSQQNSKAALNGRSNLVSTDRISMTKPSGNPLLDQAQMPQTGSNFNVTGSVATLRPQTTLQK